jgi:hypothetical protein
LICFKLVRFLYILSKADLFFIYIAMTEPSSSSSGAAMSASTGIIAADTAVAAGSVGEMFTGFDRFFAKVTAENNSRPDDQPLISRASMEEFCRTLEVFSIESLFLLALPEPGGFNTAVTNASPPCECFSVMSPMGRKMLLSIINKHRDAMEGATLPPLGVSMVGTSSASATASGTSSATSTGTVAEVGGKNSTHFNAVDLDGILRQSLSDKVTAAKAFKCFTALWRLCDKERIPDYQSGAFMVFSVDNFLVLWNNNLMSALMSSPLPPRWASARAFSQVKSMAAFTSKPKLDLFLQMKVSGQDMNSLSLADFHPGGMASWRVTDAASVTTGAKVFLRECMEGFVTALVFVFGDAYEAARALLTNGLCPSSYNAFAHPDALVLLHYHTAWFHFATLITQQPGSVERPLSGPECTVKELIKGFAHLASDKWAAPASQDFDEFNRSVFITIKWPDAKSDSTSPGKRKPEGEGRQTADPKKPKKATSTYEEREARRQLESKPQGTYAAAASLSLSGLSLGGSGTPPVSTGKVGGAKNKEERLCAAVLCGFAGVRYRGRAVKCTKGSECKYAHPDSVDDVLKDDAALAIGSLKKGTSDPDMIAYLAGAEVFYAARAT